MCGFRRVLFIAFIESSNNILFAMVPFYFVVEESNANAVKASGKGDQFCRPHNLNHRNHGASCRSL